VTALTHLLVIALSVQSAKLEVPVHNLRASRLAAMMNGQGVPGLNGERANTASLLPKGVFANFDDARELVIFSGAKEEDRTEAARILSTLDVEPRHLQVRVTFDSRVDHYQTTSAVDAWENEGWGLVSSDLGITLQMSCRINKDSTLAVFAKVMKGSNYASAAWRQDSGEKAVLSIAGNDIGVNLDTALEDVGPAEVHTVGRFADPLTITVVPVAGKRGTDEVRRMN